MYLSNEENHIKEILCFFLGKNKGKRSFTAIISSVKFHQIHLLFLYLLKPKLRQTNITLQNILYYTECGLYEY